ncbi:uncharacterized protein LOC121856928 [Homarus americanus]|uniref:uncharacterized protein LOC121856928 n=1 Tax=Homarus americanus TaxID=6706 RepID=UPI001C455664|nr:uncharacterized protein LOC121856928 [Homarus americanus]
MEVCRYFKAPGGCWYGKKCRFYHDASHVPDNQINPKICRYFGTLNGCRNGNKCRFLHIQETGSARVEEPLEGAQTCHDTLKDESSVRLKLSESDPKTPGSFLREVAAREVSEAKPNDPPYTCGECKAVFTGAGAHRNLKAHYMKMLRKFDKSHVAFLRKSDFNERSRCEFCKKIFHKARQNLEHIVEKVNSSKNP